MAQEKQYLWQCQFEVPGPFGGVVGHSMGVIATSATGAIAKAQGKLAEERGQAQSEQCALISLNRQGVVDVA